MQNGCGRCELNHVANIYNTQALNSSKSGWVIDNYSHKLYAKPERCLLQWIIAIAQPLFRGWGPPLGGGIVIWLARALRALGARQHVIGLTPVQGWGQFHFFQFNSNSGIFNSNSNSTTHNKFQFKFKFQFQRFQFKFLGFQILAISIPEMTSWCLPWNWL